MITLLLFFVGVGIGACACWLYMDWQWKENPYRFKTIVDNVIAMREAKK